MVEKIVRLESEANVMFWILIVIGALLLAMAIIDVYLLIISKAIDYICSSRANKREDSHDKVRNSYYVQNLYQWVNTSVFARSNLVHCVRWWRKPYTKTPNKGDSERAKEDSPKDFEGSFHNDTLPQAKKGINQNGTLPDEEDE